MKRFDSSHPLIIPFVLSTAAFLLELLTAATYGLFQDELYYVACAEHFSASCVDHPALVVVLTKVSLLFGHSLIALRVLPALALAGIMMLVAQIAIELGGSKFSAAVASFAILDGSVFWVMCGMMSGNPFDIFFVTLSGLLFIRTIRAPSLRHWVLLGISMGIGLNAKMTMLAFGFSLAAGLLVTSQRKQFLHMPPYVGAGVALALFIPFLIWQAIHNWPTLEFIRNATDKNLDLSLMQFFIALTIAVGPMIMLLCIIGLVFLFWSPDENKYRLSLRPLAFAVAIFFIVYLVNRSNFYYVVPAIPILVGAGSVLFERWTASKRIRWVRYGVLTLITVSAVIKLPLGIPILPIDKVPGYMQTIMGGGSTHRLRTDKSQSNVVPNYFGKRFGNEEMVLQIDSVYRALSDSDKTKCGILCNNYSNAAAVDYYGASIGLPHAISGHNTYWIWGPGEYTGQVMITVGSKYEYWHQFFARVDSISTFNHPYDGPDARIIQIFVCRDSKEPLPLMWDRLKVYR